MGRVSQKAVDGAAELFQAAGLGQVSWETALDGLAAATGSTGAQLIGLGSEATVPFNVMTGVPLETRAPIPARTSPPSSCPESPRGPVRTSASRAGWR